MTRPVPARNWLQASNPSERWKWDFMFQDLPPVKFLGKPVATSFLNTIPLTKTEYVTKDNPAFYRVKLNPIKAIKTALA